MFAHKHLLKAQQTMKETYDRKSVSREFKVGDQVLLLDPIRKSLECRYEGPYVVLSRTNNV